MFTGIINDTGLSYNGETVKEVSAKLYEYILETYGEHSVENLRKGTQYAACHIINSPGEYLITPRDNNTIHIHCTIS